MLLVLGGTRSGKSRFALARAHATGGPDVTFIATARTGDPDLDERIAGHRAHRPDGWRTIESGLDLPGAIATAPGADRPAAVLLVDCLTLWVSALVEAGTAVEPAWTELAAALDTVRAHVIAVSDEVGHGVVPAFELGRRFRDELGWLNQRVAETADDVVLTIAGIPLALKGDLERWTGPAPEPERPDHHDR
jgi:adenosylcobinamide kinase / adenosylcobinamide-phosphate guanylyltransferase